MKKIMALFVVLGYLFVAGNASAGTAMLSWNPPTQNMDGTPLTDLAGYKIYWGTESGNYTNNINVSRCVGCSTPLGTEKEFECVAGFSPGVTYYFAATAYDTSGNESPFSNEVIKTMPAESVPLGNIDTTSTGSALRVDGYDLIILQKSFGTGTLGAACNDTDYLIWIGEHEKADLNGDGKVDGVDLSILSGNFGRSQ